MLHPPGTGAASNLSDLALEQYRFCADQVAEPQNVEQGTPNVEQRIATLAASTTKIHIIGRWK